MSCQINVLKVAMKNFVCVNFGALCTQKDIFAGPLIVTKRFFFPLHNFLLNHNSELRYSKKLLFSQNH